MADGTAPPSALLRAFCPPAGCGGTLAAAASEGSVLLVGSPGCRSLSKTLIHSRCDGVLSLGSNVLRFGYVLAKLLVVIAAMLGFFCSAVNCGGATTEVSWMTTSL